MRALAPRCLALLAALLVAGAGCQSSEDRLASLLERAAGHREAGRRSEALIELRNALRLDPQSSSINLQIAELLEQEERYQDALFFFEEASRLDEQSEGAVLGVVRMRSFQDPEGARERLEALLERRPDSAAARIQSSSLAFIENDLDRALSEALTATELDPGNPAAWHQVGRVYVAQIQVRQNARQRPPDETFEKALRAFDRAEEAAGKDAAIHFAARFEKLKVLSAWPGHGAEALAMNRELAEEAAAAGDAERVASASANLFRLGIATQDPSLQIEALERLVAAQPERLQSWRRLARLVVAQGGEAEPVLQRMLEAQPENASAHLLYARYLEEREGPEAARAYLERTVETVGDPLEMLGGLLESQLREGDLPGAEATVAEMVERDANDPRTLQARGALAVRQGRGADAVQLLRRSVSAYERPEGFRLLAIALLMTGDAQEALRAIDRAIETEPSWSRTTQRIRVDVNRALGDWEGVWKDLAMLQRRAGLSPTENEMLIDALFRAGRRAAASRLLERRLAEGDPTPGLAMLHARHRGRQDPERARQLLEKALEKQPDHAGATEQLVRLELAAGDAERGLARIEAARASGLESPRLDLLEAQLLLQAGRSAEAERAAQRAFERMPGSEEAMELLVSVYFARGRLEEAIGSFEEAREAGVLDPAGQALLGRLYLRVGRADEAIRTLEDAVAGGVTRPLVLNDLAFLLAQRGTDLERALALAQEAKEKRPNDPNMSDTLGYVMLRRGLPGPAEAQFREALRLAERNAAPRPEFHYRLGLALQEQGRSEEAAAAFEAALQLDDAFPEADAARAGLEAARASASNPS